MDQLTYGTLRLREQGTTWFVQLHRPEADNAINAEMVAELGRVFALAEQSPASVVVLTGLPEVFCVGADFGVISDAVGRGATEGFDPEPMYELFERMAFSPFLTVAHVRGRANAGGVGFVAACDMVIADQRATFALSELLFGLVPAVVLPFLARRVGLARAHYLAGSTQPIDAVRARDWGLVDECDADSEALLRRQLRRLGRLSKRSVARYKSYLAELAPMPAHVRRVALDTNREVFADPDNLRAIRRYSERGLFPWE